MTSASIDIFIDFSQSFSYGIISTIALSYKCSDLLNSNEDVQFSIPLLWNRRRDREAMGKGEERVEV